MLRKYLLLLTSLFLLAGLAESSNYKDYPLIGGYPTSQLTFTQTTDYDAFNFPASVVNTSASPYTHKDIEVKGKVFQYLYNINKVSTLQVYENYTKALATLGFEVTFSCHLEECGNDNAKMALGELVAIGNNLYSMYEKPYYLLAQKNTDKGRIYAAWFIGGLNGDVAVQQTIVEEKPLENNLIKVSPEILKQQIDVTGKAAIYGIYFDAGKASIKPESKTALEAIAQLLTKNKDLMLYVVGHTDDSGAGVSNVELSRQRAEAVVKELVTTYKISEARLQAQGVGPYAPVSNNTSDIGKQKNRRVELVQRLQ